LAMTSADIREKLTEALALDLIGPDSDSPLASETLSQAPSKWYLTGFLVPVECDPPAGAVQPDLTVYDEEVDKAVDGGPGDDGGTPEGAASKKAMFPSSMGLSLLVPSDATELTVTVSWGDYSPVFEDVPAGEPAPEFTPVPKQWVRTPRTGKVLLKLPKKQKAKEYAVLNSGTGQGLQIAMMVKPVKDFPAFEQVLPKGVRSVSVFVVNRRDLTKERVLEDATFAFQAQLCVTCAVPFVPRPNVRGSESKEWDERVAAVMADPTAAS